MSPKRAAILHRYFDHASGLIICLATVFTPWAFGTTEPWAVDLMDAAAWTLGSILAAKRILRSASGWAPPRWGVHPGSTRAPGLVRLVGATSLFLLAWCLISAWNASAIYSARELGFEYRAHIAWLPHSLAAGSSWRAFYNYSALACYFWSIYDWLGTTTAEELELASELRGRFVPSRLALLLWVLSINGTLVAFEGLFQRVSGTDRLLGLVQPAVNANVESQFGPYAYRSNAAEFLNLIWPSTLGFWCWLHQWRRKSASQHPTQHLLLSCVMLMAASPLVSDSRAGAVVTLGLVLASVLLFMAAWRGASWKFRGVSIIFAIAIVLGGLNIGGGSLRSRMRSLESDLNGREEVYRTARKMARDYPWLGTGPGTFDPLFQLYRTSPEQYWPAQLHNDWLETRITFGRLGFGALLLGLAGCLGRWIFHGGIRSPWIFPALIALALVGCLVHARFDFPLQVYSILYTFLLECAVLLSISREP